MKAKLLLTTIFGVAAWSLSSLAMANWDTGPCSGGGSAPCIETEINGNTYHFNGSGGHAGVWHGRPAAEGGGPFDFSGSVVELNCPGIGAVCNLTLSGQVKKCQDFYGSWRFGVRVVDADLAPGNFACNFIAVSGFPWYAKETTATPQCPFEGDCDTFIPYDPSASTYVADFGAITVTVLGSTVVNSGHVRGVVFTPGVGANFAFTGPKDFVDCNGDEEDCAIDGTLTVDNATSLDVF